MMRCPPPRDDSPTASVDRKSCAAWRVSPERARRPQRRRSVRGRAAGRATLAALALALALAARVASPGPAPPPSPLTPSTSPAGGGESADKAGSSPPSHRCGRRHRRARGRPRVVLVLPRQQQGRRGRLRSGRPGGEAEARGQGEARGRVHQLAQVRRCALAMRDVRWWRCAAKKDRQAEMVPVGPGAHTVLPSTLTQTASQREVVESLSEESGVSSFLATRISNDL